MKLEDLKQEWKVFEFVRGSHMYGTNIASSDIDVGGIYKIPNSYWLNMNKPDNEAKDEKGDTVYYELRNFLTLASNANPTILESLFVPKENIKLSTPIYDELIKHRDMFITTKTYWSYTGYAFAQIKKAKGQNKKVHNVKKLLNTNGVKLLAGALQRKIITDQQIASKFNKNFLQYIRKQKLKDVGRTTLALSKDIFNHPDAISMLPPKRENYTYTITDDFIIPYNNPYADFMPFRPKSNVDVSSCDASSVEHISGLYRLYKNGKGVFNKGTVTLTSISKEREYDDFIGVVYFNQNQYEKEMKEYRSFWEWMGNRNEARWEDSDKNNFEYDKKNMMHTIRLLLEVENIFTIGRPIVKFKGDYQKFLLDVRQGKYNYDYLLGFVEDKIKEVEVLFKKSQLPHGVNHKKVNQIYQKLVGM